MSDPAVDLRIRVAGAFSTKLPNCPVLAMLVVEKLDQRIGRVAISSLRIGRGWAGGRDDWKVPNISVTRGGRSW